MAWCNLTFLEDYSSLAAMCRYLEGEDRKQETS